MKKRPRKRPGVKRIISPFQRVPTIVDKLLKPYATPWPKVAFGSGAVPSLRALLDLVREIETRVREERDPTRFGSIDDLAEEAAKLARLLGFPEAPLQPIRYERGVTRQPGPGDHVPLGWPPYPMTWQLMDSPSEPKFLSAYGWRLHHPEGASSPTEILATALVEDEGRVLDLWAGRVKIDAKGEALAILGEWRRYLRRLLREVGGATASDGPAGASPIATPLVPSSTGPAAGQKELLVEGIRKQNQDCDQAAQGQPLSPKAQRIAS